MTLPDPSAMTAALHCLHEDRALLAFDKPAGLLSVPGRGADLQDCVATRARDRWPDACVVHRLDMATSGLLLMARGAEMQRRLGRAFESRAVVKHYVAIVDDPQAVLPSRILGAMALPGVEEPGWHRIDLPVAADWPRRPRQRVDLEHGRAALTHFRVLDHAAGRTRLSLLPWTGRTHQLRVHLAAIGHAILGDALYASEAVAAASPRLLLHAHRLELDHPATGEPLRLEAPLPF